MISPDLEVGCRGTVSTVVPSVTVEPIRFKVHGDFLHPHRLTAVKSSDQTAFLMRSGRLSKAVWMAVVVPLFLAAVLPAHSSTLVCRFTGAVMAEDCCPRQPDEKVEPQTELREQACCALKTIDLARLVSDRRAETEAVRHYAPWTPIAATFIPRPATFVGLIRSIASPAVGPPIVLLKRSFLI